MKRVPIGYETWHDPETGAGSSIDERIGGRVVYGVTVDAEPEPEAVWTTTATEAPGPYDPPASVAEYVRLARETR